MKLVTQVYLINLFLFWGGGGVACYTAVFSVVTQRSSPLMAAENRTTFLSLCVCGLTTNQSCTRNLTIREPQGARKQHASQFSTNQSIDAEFRRALCFQATKLICKKVCIKRSRKFQVKKRFDRPRRLLPGYVGSSFNVHTGMYWYAMKNLMCRMCSLCSCED